MKKYYSLKFDIQDPSTMFTNINTYGLMVEREQLVTTKRDSQVLVRFPREGSEPTINALPS